MNVFETYEHLIRFELERMVSAGDLPSADFSRVSVNPPRDISQGDLVTNAALVAQSANSMALAQILAKHFVSLHDVTGATVADNGLVVLKVKPVVWHRAISGILHTTSSKDPCRGIIYDSAADFSIMDPVFSVQYARTICCAALHHAATALSRDLSDNVLAAAKFDRLTQPIEQDLMRKAVAWQHAIRGGSRPKTVYAQELAQLFCDLCAAQKGNAALGFVYSDDIDVTLALLALVRVTAIILAEAPS